jgi:glyoxylase-like metal-dependent hydrolase (beta-lactamase superfamily II)
LSDLKIHTYTAAEAGLLVNSFLVQTDEGVVVVDANLLNSDIAGLCARVEALGRPLLGVFVTHAHPDHFNGVHALVAERDIPVYATAAVAEAIEAVADAKRTQWKPVYGDEWPDVTAYPTMRLADGEAVDLGGVRFSVHDMGAAESHADSYILAGPASGGRSSAFIGDLAFHGTHPYTADGHSAAWLAALDALPAALASTERLLPGHGAPAGPSLLTAQRRYLVHYREAVRRLADGRPKLTDAAKEELEHVMTDFAPDLPLTWMIGLGADAVAAELAQETEAQIR